MSEVDRQYRLATSEYQRQKSDEELVKARDVAWAKLQKQKTCKHEHVLGPTQWTNTSMCMECGKEFGSERTSRDVKNAD